jgi:hypothetical protein
MTIESFLNESTVVWNKVQDHDVYYHVFQFDGDTFVLVKQKAHGYYYRLILIKNYKKKDGKNYPLSCHTLRTSSTNKQILECDDLETLEHLKAPYNLGRWLSDVTESLNSRGYFEVETRGTYRFYSDNRAPIDITI